VKEFEGLPLSAVIFTDVSRDGMLRGPNVQSIRAMAEVSPFPVIASGGAGEPAHFAQVLTDANADAALAASLFHDGVLPIPDLKQYLAERGIPVRVAY